MGRSKINPKKKNAIKKTKSDRAATEALFSPPQALPTTTATLAPSRPRPLPPSAVMSSSSVSQAAAETNTSDDNNAATSDSSSHLPAEPSVPDKGKGRVKDKQPPPRATTIPPVRTTTLLSSSFEWAPKTINASNRNTDSIGNLLLTSNNNPFASDPFASNPFASSSSPSASASNQPSAQALVEDESNDTAEDERPTRTTSVGPGRLPFSERRISLITKALNNSSLFRRSLASSSNSPDENDSDNKGEAEEKKYGPERLTEEQLIERKMELFGEPIPIVVEKEIHDIVTPELFETAQANQPEHMKGHMILGREYITPYNAPQRMVNKLELLHTYAKGYIRSVLSLPRFAAYLADQTKCSVWIAEEFAKTSYQVSKVGGVLDALQMYREQRLELGQVAHFERENHGATGWPFAMTGRALIKVIVVELRGGKENSCGCECCGSHVDG